ncbi:MAG TPA: hypothetical protein VKI61_10550 [Chitinophagaceae bacterium]|jgi:hypothetical protein|nr:hypothetical protein [Chitinophagaceae bacterium]
MEEKSLWQDRRTMLTNIAGKWNAAGSEDTLVFSAMEKGAPEAKLIITESGKAPVDTIYSLCSCLTQDLQAFFYIEMGNGWHNTRWFKVNEVTPAGMRLVEISKNTERKEMGGEIVYAKR